MEPISAIWAGIKVGIPTGVALFATMSIENMDVSLQVAIPVTVFICGIVWWLSKKFQQIDDRLNDMGKTIKGLPCNKHKCEPED